LTDSPAGTLLLGTAFLLLLLALQALLMTVWVGGLPNQLVAPPVQHAEFYLSLLQSQPSEALRLIFFEKPLLEIERRQVISGLSIQTWSVAVFTPGLLIQVFLAGYLALVIKDRQRWPGAQWAWRILGIGVVMLSVMNCRRADCCVGGPGRLFDVWLLSYLIGQQAITDWQQVYVDIRRWFVLAQLLLGLVGFMMIFHSHRKQGTNPR